MEWWRDVWICGADRGLLGMSDHRSVVDDCKGRMGQVENKSGRRKGGCESE